MSRVYYKGHKILLQPNETILSALLRQGIEIPFSCQAGICKVCLMRSEKGSPPVQASEGLSQQLVQEDHFMACKCIPEQDMYITDPTRQQPQIEVHIKQLTYLSKHVVALQLESLTPLKAHAGQYIHLKNPQDIIRTYSIAELNPSHTIITLHIQLWPQGKMSTWLTQHAHIGETVRIYEPQGHCFYQPEIMQAHPLVLIATGTGVAPLWGIIQEALAQGHKHPITLYHGSRHLEGLYLHTALQRLAQHHAQFSYIACLSADPPRNGIYVGRAHEAAFASETDLSQAIIMACGRPQMVDTVEQYLQQKGGAASQFFADKFVGAAPTNFKHQEETHLFPPQDDEMWTALQSGKLLALILQDFYDKVYEDPQLAPFFTVTKTHAIGKQFAFLSQAFSGENIYFGEHPRNAHHWMVISNELFDYREQLMEDSLRKFQLPEHLIQRWLGFDNKYREQMVKREPWPKIIFGQELPLDGYERIVLEGGGICDGCTEVVENKEEVSYHLRLAKVYCNHCLPNPTHPIV